MRVRFILVAVAAAFLLVACGSNPGTSSATEISATELADRIQAGSAPFILDVRTPQEFSQGHIPGAVNIPHDQLEADLAELPFAKDDEVVVHCQAGHRAGMAEKILRENGYTNVRDLSGQWQGWKAAGLPSE